MVPNEVDSSCLGTPEVSLPGLPRMYNLLHSTGELVPPHCGILEGAACAAEPPYDHPHKRLLCWDWRTHSILESLLCDEKPNSNLSLIDRIQVPCR